MAGAFWLCGCEGVKSTVGPSAEPALQPSVPPLVTPGQYVVTIRADAACDLPEVAKQRTFAAEIFSDPWEGILFGELLGVSIRSTEYYDFWLRDMTPTTQAFYVGNYFGNVGIMEEVAEGLVLLFGKAVIAPNNSTMSGRLDGTVGYCTGPRQPGAVPAEACRTPPVICESESHQLDLERM
jgi:hypothetical protein